MSQDKELKELARRAYISYHQDGLIDILLGIGITGFGLMLLTGSVVFNILAWMPIIFYVPLKNRITVPRFGFVQFRSEQKKRNYLWLAAAVGVVALVFFLGLVVFTASDRLPEWLDNLLSQFSLLVVGFLLAIPIIIGGLLSGLNRLYGYAVLIIGGILLGSVLGIDGPLIMIFLGLVILTVGVTLLVHFLRQYPLDGEGA